MLRYRTKLVHERGREVQRMQKVVEGANIRLDIGIPHCFKTQHFADGSRGHPPVHGLPPPHFVGIYVRG